MENAVKKYRNRRDARLGMKMSQHFDSIEEYRLRRAERLKKSRMDADDEEGVWRTTDNGHKILIKDGIVVGGNPFAVAPMGKPEGKDIPKTVKQVKENRELFGFLAKKENRDSMAESLSGRKEDCVFGGYYKVQQKEGNALFFNPYTGETFDVTTAFDFAGPWGMEYNSKPDKLGTAIEGIKVNEQVQKLYRRATGDVQKGDTVQVVGGRTLEHGLKAKVRAVYDTRYGKYVYLDNGQKIQAKHLSIVDEDGDLVRSSEGKSSDASKALKEKREAETKITAEISEKAVREVIGDVKTKAKVLSALKQAGYKVSDETDEGMYGKSGFNYKIKRPNGGFVRIYKSPTGRINIQDWKPTPVEETKLRSDDEIKDAKFHVNNFLEKHKKDESFDFDKLPKHEKYFYVMAKTASYFLSQGMSPRKAWTRALDTADFQDSKNYEGYGKTKSETEEAKEFLEALMDGLRK